MELARGIETEKQSQLNRLAQFHERHRHEAPAVLKQPQEVDSTGGKVFDSFMRAVPQCSIAQIINAAFEVGGQDRRNI